jgi:hypothetical protein
MAKGKLPLTNLPNWLLTLLFLIAVIGQNIFIILVFIFIGAMIYIQFNKPKKKKIKKKKNILKEKNENYDIDPQFMHPSSVPLNDAKITKYQLPVVEDLYIDESNNKSTGLNQIKEVKGNVYVSSEFKEKPLKNKIIVGNYIMCHANKKKYDVDFYKQYFDFDKIWFFYKNGNSKEVRLQEQKWTSIKHYEYLTVNNTADYNKLLKKVDKKGTLNYSLRIEVTLDQDPCLQSLNGIKKIKGAVFIYNPFFSDMGDVESVKNLEIRNFKNQPPIDLKNLKYIEDNEYGSLLLNGNIKSFGKLEIINGDLDLTKCDFTSYDNIKEIKGDLRIKHKYKGLYNKPKVEGRTYHRRTNKLINILDDGWSENSDSAQNRRDDFDNLPLKFEKVYKLVVEKDFSKAYSEFQKIKYPDNLTFFKRHVYKDFDKGIRNPSLLRYDGHEVWLLYFYHKNLITIDSNFILKLCGFSRLITEIGKQNIEELMPFLDNEIKAKTPYNLDCIDFNWIESDFINFLQKHKKHHSYNAYSDNDDLQYVNMRTEINKLFEDTIINAENKFRESKGIKRVGEYWKNETELYYKLKEIFPNEDIVQHGNPAWLGEQHLDIYFTHHNIGVEYHGEQHFKAIKIFGGQEGLIKTKERDERKRRLCKDNSCHLIEIRKDYDINDLKLKIETLINSSSDFSQIRQEKLF